MDLLHSKRINLNLNPKQAAISQGSPKPIWAEQDIGAYCMCTQVKLPNPMLKHST